MPGVKHLAIISPANARWHVEPPLARFTLNNLSCAQAAAIGLASAWLTVGVHAAVAQDTKSSAAYPGNEFVNVRLTSEKSTVALSGTSDLAVIFDITPGWHLYWRNPGDSGLPPRVAFKPIDGVTFGPPQWPVPKRKVEGDMLLDYIYERELVLIVPVTLDARFAGGSSLPLTAEVEWLVCKERCLQGRAILTASIPVADGGSLSPDAKRFSDARARHPILAAEFKTCESRWEGPRLTIRVKDATSLTFFPYENDENVYPHDLIRDGSVKSDTLRLRYGEDVARLKRVAGILSVTRSGRETYLEISVKPPDLK